MSEKILDKIAKVLALAERTDNEHEADAFLKQAQAMATRYSIDLARARRHTARTQHRQVPTQRTVDIGVSGRMGNSRLVKLYLAIAHTNDVQCNVATNSTYVVPFGFPSDLEVVDALYAHLSVQMTQAATDYLRRGTFRDEVALDREGRRVRANAKSARLSFYDAFIGRVAERLSEAQRQAETDAVAEDRDDDATGTALVLADKRAEVADFYRSTSRAKGSWSGWHGTSGTVGSALRAGRAAGDRARLAAVPTLPKGRQEIA